MTKSTITRLFAAAVAFVVVGAVIGTVAVVAAIANGAILLGGPTAVSVNAGPIAGAVAAIVVGSLLVSIGTVAAIASWAGALLNTSRFEDKTWFVVLLALGLVSMGWVAMIAYVFAGPDSTSLATPGAAQATSRS